MEVLQFPKTPLSLFEGTKIGTDAHCYEMNKTSLGPKIGFTFMLLVNNKTRVEMLRIKKNLKLSNEIIKCGVFIDFENCSQLRN